MNKTAKKLTWEQATLLLDILEQREKWRELMMVATGIYTGLRYDDWSVLRWCDLQDSLGVPYDTCFFTEGKTGKTRQVNLAPNFQRIIHKCRRQTPVFSDNARIFQGERGPVKRDQSITNATANKWLSNIAPYIGEDEITTHTLRKTWGYQMYKLMAEEVGSGEALIYLKKAFNHTNLETTIRYLGLDNDFILKTQTRLT